MEPVIDIAVVMGGAPIGAGGHDLHFWRQRGQGDKKFDPPPKKSGGSKNFLLASLAEFVPPLSKPWRRPWTKYRVPELAGTPHFVTMSAKTKLGHFENIVHCTCNLTFSAVGRHPCTEGTCISPKMR